MVNIVHSIRSWLGLSEDHTAFIHCLHPERLIVFVRCLLARQQPTDDERSAVEELCDRITPALPLPPSHNRYVGYYQALERSGCDGASRRRPNGTHLGRTPRRTTGPQRRDSRGRHADLQIIQH